LRATVVTFRLAAARRFFGTFGNSRCAPRTAFRAVPVATKATPAAMSVAIVAALPAVSLIVLPAVVIMPFLAIAESPPVGLFGTCQGHNPNGSVWFRER